MTKMRDVAELAGVSVMTVSNVLNNKPRVNAETRLRVLNAIEATGYKVNINARRLRQGTSNAIAMIVPRLDHPYFGELTARFTERLAGTGRHLVVEQTNALLDNELAAISQSHLNSYAGIILSSVGMTSSDVDSLNLALPVVLLGEQPMPTRYDHLAMGNLEGATIAVEHLLKSGARKIVMLGGDEFNTDIGMMASRTEGWRAAHRKLGAHIDDRLVITLDEFETRYGYDKVSELISQNFDFDAIFAITDTVAIGALAALQDHGKRIPHDVQVIGFDNLELGSYLRPSLSTIDPDRHGMVDTAFNLLEERIAHGYDNVPAQHLTSTVKLVQRASTRGE